jgi:hypothetical protein
MAARNSPESPGRNSPLHSDLVTAQSLRQSDIGEGFEVELDDRLKCLAVALSRRLSGKASDQAAYSDERLGTDVLGDQVGVLEQPVAGAFNLDYHGMVEIGFDTQISASIRCLRYIRQRIPAMR